MKRHVPLCSAGGLWGGAFHFVERGGERSGGEKALVLCIGSDGSLLFMVECYKEVKLCVFFWFLWLCCLCMCMVLLLEHLEAKKGGGRQEKIADGFKTFERGKWGLCFYYWYFGDYYLVI